jgi:GAG-pre-integrase domain
VRLRSRSKFRKHDCTVTNLSGDIVLSGKRDSGLYYYESSDIGQMLMAAGDTTLAELAHRRLGHLHYRSLQQLTSLVDGLVIGKIPLEPCEDCLKAKHTRNPFQTI